MSQYVCGSVCVWCALITCLFSAIITVGNVVARREFSGDHAFTIRHAGCELILAIEGKERCSQCAKYRWREISWEHLRSLYERDNGRGTGLALVPKLKYKHIYKLSSFAKMRVDLAAQVGTSICCKGVDNVIICRHYSGYE